MFAWRHRGEAWLLAPWLRNSLLLLGFVGCSESPCSGQSCPTATSTNENYPTSAPVDAEPDAGALPVPSAPASETGEAPSECRVDEDCSEQAPVCSENRRCVPCLGDEDCGDETRPYCKVAADEKKNRCVACQKGTDCGAAGAWECIDEQCFEACDPTDGQSCDNGLVCVAGDTRDVPYCAECGPGAACADSSLVCVNNTCVECDPETGSGCATDEFCEPANASAVGAGDAGPSEHPSSTSAKCVQCRSDVGEDCPGGTCVDGLCQVCSPESNAGCGGETPVCKVSEADAGGSSLSCVQCVSSDDCDGNAGGARCVDDRCVSCDPADNSGCSGKLGTCIDIAPAGATPLFECKECLDTCGDGLLCVGFACVDCEDSTHCENARAPECTSEYECAGCTTDAACAHRPETPHCDTASGTCVECTDGSHCPDNPGGCLTFPGQDLYTCAPLETTPHELAECARCNSGECAGGYVCATLEGDDRCLPLAEPDDPCGPSELYAEEELGLVVVCIPEDCAP